MYDRGCLMEEREEMAERLDAHCNTPLPSASFWRVKAFLCYCNKSQSIIMWLLAIPQVQRNDEKRSDMTEAIIFNMTHHVHVIPREDSHKCFQHLRGAWSNVCVLEWGEYYEGD